MRKEGLENGKRSLCLRNYIMAGKDSPNKTETGRKLYSVSYTVPQEFGVPPHSG